MTTKQSKPSSGSLLPLVEQRPEVIAGGMNLNKDFASGYLKGMVEQRDADLERVRTWGFPLEALERRPTLLQEMVEAAEQALVALRDQFSGWESAEGEEVEPIPLLAAVLAQLEGMEP